MPHSPVMPKQATLQTQVVVNPPGTYPPDWVEQMDGFLTMAENMARNAPSLEGSDIAKAQVYALCAIGKALVRLCAAGDK